MCTVSFVIDSWRDSTWPHYPKYPHNPQVPAPANPIPWPVIQQDPSLAKRLLEVLDKLETIDKRLGALEKCRLTVADKKRVKRDLKKIAETRP